MWCLVPKKCNQKSDCPTNLLWKRTKLCIKCSSLCSLKSKVIEMILGWLEIVFSNLVLKLTSFGDPYLLLLYLRENIQYKQAKHINNFEGLNSFHSFTIAFTFCLIITILLLIIINSFHFILCLYFTSHPILRLLPLRKDCRWWHIHLED